MKPILTFIAVVIVAVVVYFAFVYQRQMPEVNAPTDTSSQGKLNINVVCEGALSYMTFMDGSSAEKFVAECKEGKHPEVIDRYKTEMNLGDGATI